MDTDTIKTNLLDRLQSDLDHFQGKLPRDYAIAWRAYFAALLEWGILDVATHRILWSLLPDIENDPVMFILLGREEGES